jgi:hypothetical protein
MGVKSLNYELQTPVKALARALKKQQLIKSELSADQLIFIWVTHGE